MSNNEKFNRHLKAKCNVKTRTFNDTKYHTDDTGCIAAAVQHYYYYIRLYCLKMLELHFHLGPAMSINEH